VFGRERHGIAQADRIGLVGTRKSSPALRLVGDDDHGFAGAADEIGQRLVSREDTRTRIDQEKDHIRIVNGGFGLRPHPVEQRALVGILDSRGVDHPEGEISESGFALAPVPRHSGPVVD
jgi:hypothetical protein